MKYQRYARWGAVLSVFTMIAGFAGCSTSGGKQEPVVENYSSGRDLKGSVPEVNDRAKAAFQQMGIKVTGTKMEKSGKQQDLTGKAGDKTVSVTMKDIGDGMTHVDVSAREGTLQWNQDYANAVLQRIVKMS